MKYKFLLLLALLPITVIAQQSNVIYTDSVVMSSKKYLKGNDYQKDFMLFMDMLENTHPAFAMENPPLDIKKIRKVGYKELKKFNDSEKFALYLESIVSQLHDGHTYIYCNYPSDTIFPMAFKYLNGEFFIQGVEEGNDEFIGKKILTVNGFDMYDVMMSFGSLLSCDNDIFLIERFNCITKFFWEDNKYNTQEALTVTCDDGSSLNLNYLSAKEIKWKWVETKPLQSPYQKTQMPFRYEVYPENSICYLQFSSFKDKNTLRWQFYSGDNGGMSEEEFEKIIKDYPRFDTFLQEVFDSIHKCEINTLVVDVRGNGGGNSTLMYQLMSWIIPTERIDDLNAEGTLTRVSKFLEAHYIEVVKYYKNLTGDKFHYGMIIDEDMYEYDSEDIDDEDDSSLDTLFVYNEDPEQVFTGNVIFIQDHWTFSAAGTLILVAYDNKIGTIIGEESSYRPCNFTDCLLYELPNTKVKGGVSFRYATRPNSDACCGKSLIPTIHIERTWSDYLEGRDPWWQWILENK